MNKSNRKASVHKKSLQKQNYFDMSVNASPDGSLQLRVISHPIVQGASGKNLIKILLALLRFHWTVHVWNFLTAKI